MQTCTATNPHTTQPCVKYAKITREFADSKAATSLFPGLSNLLAPSGLNPPSVLFGADMHIYSSE